MFNKKRGFLILLLMIVGICAMSSVNASDDVADTLTVDEAQIDDAPTAIEEVNEVAAVEGEDLAAANDDENVYEIAADEVDDGDKLSADGKDVVLSKDQSEEVLSYSYPSYSAYEIKLDSKYTITGLADSSIRFSIDPDIYMADYAFYFSFKIYKTYTNKKFSNLIFESGDLYSTSYDRSESYWTYTFKKGSLPAGTYYLTAINYKDSKVMDYATLVINKKATIISEDYNQFYNAGKIPVRVIDQSTGNPAAGFAVKATFSNGVTRTYTTDSNGYANFVPPVGVGKYSLTLSSADGSISAPAVVKSVTLKKAGVNIKASKVVEYKGFKTTLKATVKSGGNKVNEGKVAFKINGKTYKVNVKNGVATKKINLKKIKTYKYTAKYLGTANLKASKNVKAKATLKKRQNVKIKFKRPVVYMGQTKKVVVKITSKGKKVKSGLLYIRHKNGVDKVKVTKGKVVLYAVGLVSDHYKGTNGITTYYKKTVTKKFWMKYVPTEHKYKGVKVNYKATSKYKCPTCGKTGSHNHYSYGYFVKYTYPIKVT